MNKYVYVVADNNITFWSNRFNSAKLHIVEIPYFGQTTEAVIRQAKSEVCSAGICIHVHFATTDHAEMARWLEKQQSTVSHCWHACVREYSTAIRRCTTSIEDQKLADNGARLVKAIADTETSTTGGKLLKVASIFGVLFLVGAGLVSAK